MKYFIHIISLYCNIPCSNVQAQGVKSTVHYQQAVCFWFL
jgi:hypothetical protein